jgi:hypothetical protein
MATRKWGMLVAGIVLLLLTWPVSAAPVGLAPGHAERGYYWHPEDQLPGTLERVLYEARGEDLWVSEEPCEFRIALEQRLNDVHTFFRPSQPPNPQGEKRLQEAARQRYAVARSPEVKALLLWHRLLDHATTVDAWRHDGSSMVRGAALGALSQTPHEPDVEDKEEFLKEATAWLTGEAEIDLKYVVSWLAYQLPAIREHLQAVPVEGRWRLMKRLAWYLESPTPAIRGRVAWAMTQVNVPGGDEFLMSAIDKLRPAWAVDVAERLFRFDYRPSERWDSPAGLRLLRHLMANGNIDGAYFCYKESRGPTETAKVLLSTQLASLRPDVSRMNELAPEILATLAKGWRPADYTDAEVKALRELGLKDEIADALLQRPGTGDGADKGVEPMEAKKANTPDKDD